MSDTRTLHRKEIKLTSILNDNGFEVTVIERQDQITWEIELEKLYGGKSVLVIVRNDDSLQDIVQQCGAALVEENQIRYEEMENFEV